MRVLKDIFHATRKSYQNFQQIKKLDDVDHLRILAATVNQYHGVEKGHCQKVQVGAAIISLLGLVSVGTNVSVPNICDKGCLKVQKYGDNSSEHRNPTDCRAVHAEIIALTKANMNYIIAGLGTILVTRYPCEACARAIVGSKRIRTVVYNSSDGYISSDTVEILKAGDIEVKAYEVR